MRVTKPSIAILSRKDGDGIILECQFNDYFPDKLNVTWLRDGQPYNGNKRVLQNTKKGEKNFTYISQIQINSRYEHTNYLCKGIHNSEPLQQEFNMCRAMPFVKPSIQTKINPLRDILNEGKVKITCVVKAPDNTILSWLVDGIKTTKDVKENKDLDNNYVSKLTLSRHDWLNKKSIVCTAKHPCFQKENARIPADDIKKDPVVGIRRSFMESSQEGLAVLECVVNDLPPGEVCIIFQANHAKISDFECVDWIPSKNNWSLIKRFTIPNNHKKRENTFTCKVHRFFKEWTSNSTGNIFDDPSSELVIGPSEIQSGLKYQKLLCSAAGFDPKIQWLSKSGVESRNSLVNTLMEDGHVKVYSEILVPQGEWEEGFTYTCQTTDRHSLKTVEKNISICSVIAPCSQKADIYLLGPPIISMSSEFVDLTCLVISQNVKYFDIQWKVNGKTDKVFIQSTNHHANGTQSIENRLKVSVRTWKSYAIFTCEVKHLCSVDTQQKNISKTRDSKQPTVRILRPSDSDLPGFENISLVCFITGFFPSDIFVEWKLNGAQLDSSQFTNSPVVAHTSEGFSMHSALILPAAQHKDGIYTCAVSHESSERPITAMENFYEMRVTKPSIAILSRKDGDKILLECQFNDYFPSKLNVTWLRGDQPFNGNERMLQNTDKGEKNFTYISQIHINSQYEDINYICKGTHDSEVFQQEYNKCRAMPLVKPSIQTKINPLRDILNEGKVKITCVVKAPDNTILSWLVDKIKTTKDVIENKDQDNNYVSKLTLSRRDWLNKNSIVCSAKHPCFHKEDARILADDIKNNPVVEIRRSFMKSARAGLPMLECVVNDLPSGEVCIIFQANNTRISDFDCVEWVPSINNWSLIRYFAIPNEYKTREKTFTCKVHRFFKEWTSNSTGNIFDDPSSELVIGPSETQSGSKYQKLLCSAAGFDPKIQWVSKSGVESRNSSVITLMEDGHVKVYSEILVPQDKWDEGFTYTCQTTDRHSSKTVEKNISICSVIAPCSQKADVYLLGPPINSTSSEFVYLTCLVISQNVKYFDIQWKVNGKTDKVFNQITNHHANGTQSIENKLKVSVRTWKSYDIFTCEVKHLCFVDTQQKNISKTRDPKQPTVRILRPSDSDLSGLENTSLVCFITGFFPSDIFVEWELNGTQLDSSQFTNSPVVAHTSGGFSMHSALILPAAQHKDGIYTCAVSHESSESPITATLENLYVIPEIMPMDGSRFMEVIEVLKGLKLLASVIQCIAISLKNEPSLVHSAPSTQLLQGANELVCLAFGFSPSAINITWQLGTADISGQSETKSAKDPDGKFIMQSHLPFQPLDWAPGEVYTCTVIHVTGTQLLNVSKNPAIFEEAIFFNENRPEAISQDSVGEVWNMACAFLVLFLISLLYGCTVTLTKLKSK